MTIPKPLPRWRYGVRRVIFGGVLLAVVSVAIYFAAVYLDKLYR